MVLDFLVNAVGCSCIFHVVQDHLAIGVGLLGLPRPPFEAEGVEVRV